MRSVQTVQKRTWLLVGSFMTLLVLALAACGTNVGSGSTSTGTSSATPTASASSYGCPGSVMNTSPGPANIVLRESDHNSTITAHVGDVIEVDLPFGQSWTGPITSQGKLQLQTPAGFALPASKMCVWRFTVQSAGTTQLQFYGQAICKKGAMCPLYIVRLPYTIVSK